MVRKSFVVLAVFTVYSFLATPGFAGLLKGDVAKGPIVSIDAVRQEITVADSRSGANITYKVSADVTASFQKGQAVIIFSDPGSNVAKSVRPVQKRR